MLSINNSIVSFSAQSRDEEDNLLASMEAYYYNNEDVRFTVLVHQNSESIDSDFSAFKAHIFACQEEIEAIINGGEEE